LFIIFNHYFTI